MLAVATFTDPRPTALSSERESIMKEKHETLVSFLRNSGFDVIDLNSELGKYSSFEDGGNFGIESKDESTRAARIVASNDVAGAIIGLWHWTESNLVTAFARESKVPLLLYADDDPAWAGSTCITSVGASLWESSINEHALRHFRIKGDTSSLLTWARAAEAIRKLSTRPLLIFGAPYTLGMEHLMDDLPALKRIVEDFLMIDQYLIVKKAEEVDEKRVEEFYEWLFSKTEIKFDEKMLTPESLKRQIRLYLASKELSDKNVAGVSIKCQPELSEVYGTTACLIPAFFPFSVDAEGEKAVIPTTCEGDIKGTITSSILYFLSNKPPLFGDIKYIDDEVIIIANCGASSLYYARLSENPDENLRGTTLQAQCQGKSGAALTYRTPPATFTFARLIRRNGKHYLLYFLGEGIDIDEKIEEKLLWGKQWPHTAIRNPLDKETFLNVMGANHLSAVPGDYTRELWFVARMWGVRGINLNDPSDAKRFIEELV